MKPCMQHVGHPKCHPAGRKAEETPIDDQNASRKVTGGAKITEHPSKTWGKAWKSTNFPPALSRFLNATPWLTEGNRNVKGKVVLAS